MNKQIPIAVIGGTGKLGHAISIRLTRAGYDVAIGSRDKDRAECTANSINELVAGANIEGLRNEEATERSNIVILCVPFSEQVEILASIKQHLNGKILIDTTVPLIPPKVTEVQLPTELSAALRAQDLLGGSVTVASTFHNIAAHKLLESGSVDCDLLVFGDTTDTRNKVIEILNQIGLNGVHAGALRNSTAAEALTSILIFMNKYYNSSGTGIRISGL